jgi:curved DNA-binding protein CbpA
MNPYRILGVKKKATDEEIKTAFREKAKQFHPDKEGGDSEKFSKINEAYSTLKNKESREYFDKTGSTINSKESRKINKAIEIIKHFIYESSSEGKPVFMSVLHERMRRDISNISRTLLELRETLSNIEKSEGTVIAEKRIKPNCFEMALESLIDDISSQIKQQESTLNEVKGLYKIIENYKTVKNAIKYISFK